MRFDNSVRLFYDLVIDKKYGGNMATTTVSSKYQVVIPKAVREKLRLRRGQRMTVVVKGGIVHLVPEKPAETFRGFLKGMDSKGVREDSER